MSLTFYYHCFVGCDIVVCQTLITLPEKNSASIFHVLRSFFYPKGEESRFLRKFDSVYQTTRCQNLVGQRKNLFQKRLTDLLLNYDLFKFGFLFSSCSVWVGIANNESGRKRKLPYLWHHPSIFLGELSKCIGNLNHDG